MAILYATTWPVAKPNGFEKWLQEGVSCITRKYPKGWPDIYKEFPCHHFVMTGSDQEHNLIGSMVASHDKSGRTYPFATLALVTGSIFQHHRASLPQVSETYFRAAKQLLESLAEVPSAKDVCQQLAKLSSRFQQPVERDLLERRIKTLAEYAMQEYWEGLQDQLPSNDRELFFFTFF